MKKKGVNPTTSNEVAKYTEKHLKRDIDIWSTARERRTYEVRARELAIAHKLEMTDIEFQGDGSKQRSTTRQMIVSILEC
jgi:hypothetical protein